MKENETPQQLALLPTIKTSSTVPLQFRLDEATRRRGLQHVAELRQLLAARQAAKANDTRERRLPSVQREPVPAQRSLARPRPSSTSPSAPVTERRPNATGRDRAA